MARANHTYCAKAHKHQCVGVSVGPKTQGDGYYCVDFLARVRWRLAADPRRRRLAQPTLVLCPPNGVVRLPGGHALVVTP